MFLCLGETDRGEKGHEIYINLIMLLVPCVFLLELTAGREWRDMDRKGDTERDRERFTDSLRGDIMRQFGFK